MKKSKEKEMRKTMRTAYKYLTILLAGASFSACRTIPKIDVVPGPVHVDFEREVTFKVKSLVGKKEGFGVDVRTTQAQETLERALNRTAKLEGAEIGPDVCGSRGCYAEIQFTSYNIAQTFYRSRLADQNPLLTWHGSAGRTAVLPNNEGKLSTLWFFFIPGQTRRTK